eukprot:782800-Pelagomonas_calceolata.AAC.4
MEEVWQMKMTPSLGEQADVTCLLGIQFGKVKEFSTPCHQSYGSRGGFLYIMSSTNQGATKASFGHLLGICLCHKLQQLREVVFAGEDEALNALQSGL